MLETMENTGDSQEEKMSAARATFRVALIGLGIAGRERIRDIPKMSPLFKGTEHVELAGFVSRRTIGEIDGVPQLNLSDVMTENNDIKAVIISTENARHEELARQALEAKKHVLVEYPITLNANAAKELQVLAHKQGVLCYEEDVALIMDKFQALKSLVKTQGPLVEANLNMWGGFNGWIEDFTASGSPFHSSMHLIHVLVDMFGDLQPYSCEIQRTENEITAKAVLQTKLKRFVNLNITRGPEVKIAKKFRYEFTDGSVVDETTALEDLSVVNRDKPQPLFMRDFLQFMQSVSGTRDNTYNQWLTIRGLEIADELFSMAKENPRSIL